MQLPISALNMVAGLLFLLRSRERQAAGPGPILAALPSLVMGGVVIRLSEEGIWTPACQALFGFGAAWSVVSLLQLGRSFALLPARRALVVRGPFRLVRHPAYLGELLMVLAAAAAAGGPAGIGLALAAPLLTGLRIRAEEQVLVGDPGWKAYREAVRWRLLPGLW